MRVTNKNNTFASSTLQFSISPRALLMALSLAVISAPPASATEQAPPTTVPSIAAQSIAEKFAGASTAASEAQKRLASDEDAARKKAAAAKKRAEAARADAKRREHEQSALAVRKADEAEMLLRAKTEATDREAEEKRADAELTQAVDAATAARLAEVERIKAQAIAHAKAEMVEREQAEEAEAIRRVAENRKREQQAAEINPQQPYENVDQPSSHPPADHAPTDNERRALSAQREAETLQLAARLKEARRVKAAELERTEHLQKQAETQPASEPKAAAPSAEPDREAELTAAPLTPTQTPAKQTASAPALQTLTTPPAAMTSMAARATVLLVLSPGDYGIRRFNQAQADPVLCTGEVCYVSQGPDVAAKALPRKQALGPGNTLGARAGSCRQQLSCIFRDVDFGSGFASLQPVDLHVLRHDRREVTTASVDASCNLVAGSLLCGSAIDATTYRAWVVPEPTAVLAGGPALTAALQAKLATRRAAAN